MANSFVKWCRAKFLNGYKHINVLAQEEGCGRSDTETLVRACEDDILLTPAPTPTPHLQGNGQGPHGNLSSGAYVEEVSCDVSVAAGGEADRQEFSFTLYDFDGHGKVTKDDIAGLVRTIYDAVGSSLSLPPSGSRTIRVKLTVAPENRRGKNYTTQGHDQHQHQDQDDLQQHMQQDLGDMRKDEEIIDPCEHSSGRSHRRRKTRRRSTSLQRHELLQIIQANMEKNNLYYTPFHRRHDHHHHHDHHHNRRRRRHACSCDHSGSPPDPAEVKARLLEPDCPCRHTHYHSHTHGHPNNPANTSGVGSCRRHNRSHSHDLSHDSPHVFRCHLLDKTFQPLPPSNTPDQPPSPPAGRNSSSHHPQYQPHHPRHYHYHHRSRSFDGGDTHGSSPRGRSARVSRNHQNGSSQVANTQQAQTQHTKQEFLIGTEMSPHHTKHRHREADHARAMAQVVAWLERGSLLDSSGSPTTPESGGSAGEGGNSGGACREQTHHVHQHIHHHYHHYTEKPPPLLI
ncbi:LOW QUALITY PROTEIN: protein naked cuticle homolog 1 [Palaemon carinicauda]|uniref:LOW QUALITY PROTEIN: protein naked cuticle homolog 1 n=1 Tax=Palaemon carinicauda TaxID=392227 RepID=UPI0035B69E58